MAARFFMRISKENGAVSKRQSAQIEELSLRTSAHTGVAIRTPKAFPSGEGGSRVPRKRETDEGLASPYGRGAPQGRRGRFYPLSHFVTAPPKWEPRGTRETDCHTSVATLVRNDSIFAACTSWRAAYFARQPFGISWIFLAIFPAFGYNTKINQEGAGLWTPRRKSCC